MTALLDHDHLAMHRIRAATLAITELSSVREVGEQIVCQACHLVGARRGALGIARPDGDELAEVVTVDLAGLDATAAQAHDLQGMLVHELAAGAAAASPASHLAARLEVEHRALGCLCVFDRRDGAVFGDDDRHVLELYAEQAAVVLGYARQLESVQETQRRVAGLHDELSAAVAHDMRTPASSLMLQLELLLDRAAPRDADVPVPIAALHRLLGTARRIARMIDDLLDASRLDLRRMALDRRQVSLGEAIANLVAQLGPTLGHRAVHVDACADVPHVHADPMRIDEIVTNLVENAAKYSSPGRPITIRVARDGRGATLTVEDEGSGIAADDLPRVFDRFFQGRRVHAKRSGLGLGLYITKGLVEAHGGRIWVDSEPGKGSRFHVWLPAADPGAADEPELDASR